MCRRSRLFDSLRWWVIGWIKMVLSQADAVKSNNVSYSAVQRLWNPFYISGFCVQKSSSRPATTPAGDRFLALSAQRKRTTSVTQLASDHFIASGKTISSSIVRIFYTNTKFSHLFSFFRNFTFGYQIGINLYSSGFMQTKSLGMTMLNSYLIVAKKLQYGQIFF